MDILNPDLEANPTRDWNAVYVPYCDGSFFAGDSEIDDNLNDKGIRIHHGLANLTAAFEVAAMHVPSPRKVLLAGSSGEPTDSSSVAPWYGTIFRMLNCS